MVNMRKALTTRKLITLLHASLGPVNPREEFVNGLRERLANLPGMPVLVERPRHWVELAVLAGVGIVGILRLGGRGGGDGSPLRRTHPRVGPERFGGHLSIQGGEDGLVRLRGSVWTMASRRGRLTWPR